MVLCFYVEIVATPKVSDEFRHARAHVARMALFERDGASGKRAEVVELVRRARERGP